MPPTIEKPKDRNRLVMLAYPKPGPGFTKETCPKKCVLKENGAAFEIPLGGFSHPIPFPLAKLHVGSMRFWGPQGGGGNGINLEIREIVAGQAAPTDPNLGANDFDVKTAPYSELVTKAISLGLVTTQGVSKEALQAFILEKSQVQ